MTELVISDADRKKAEDFLVGFLSELLPDADLSAGSITRDHTISALASSIALLRAEARNVRLGTSLRTVSQLASLEDYDDAVDNLVANWFITRRTGRQVRGTALIIFSELHDGSVPANAVFTRSSGRRFLLDNVGALVYSASNLTPRYNTNGFITGYALRVPVIAERPGSAYELPPGTFADVPSFNRFVRGMENDAAFVGAKDAETTEELLARAATAITVRDLNSERSIDTVLTDLFPLIDFLTVIGHGDPSMQRDRADLASPYNVHTGGHIDVYVATPIATRRVFEGVVGGIFTDTRPGIRIFKDTSVPDWRATGVVAGDVLRHINASASERSLYVIGRVTRHFLELSTKQEFPDVRPGYPRGTATYSDGAALNANTLQSSAANFSGSDLGRYVRIAGGVNAANNADRLITAVDPAMNSVTLSPATLVVESGLQIEILSDVVIYSIGNNAPLYNQKTLEATTGEFSREYREDGHVLLPSEPVYLIREVSVLNAADPDTDAVTGRVEFVNRVNQEPVASPGAASAQFRVRNSQPLEAQSSKQFMTVEVGPAPAYTGQGGSFNNANVFTAQQAVFNAGMIGSELYISRAVNAGNRGPFTITSYVSPSQVGVEKQDDPLATTVAENRLWWETSEKKKYDGFPCRVVYDTILNFPAIDAYVSNRQNRVICADTMVRGFHPVYVSLNIRYGLKSNALTVLDEDDARAKIAAYISSFPTTEDVLHLSDIVTYFNSTYRTVVGYVESPITADYVLLAPDGREIPYRSVDAVVLKPQLLASGLPHRRLEDPSVYGVTDRTIRYLSDVSLITLTKVL